MAVKKRWRSLWLGYLAFVGIVTLAVQGRSPFEWVCLIVPAGKIRDLLVYPLQHHHPVTFAKVLNIGHFIGNILLFLPFGMGIYLLARRMFPDSIRKILLTALISGLILSTSIELLQYFIPQRIPSAADVIENTGGAVLGCYLLYFRKMYRKISATNPR